MATSSEDLLASDEMEDSEPIVSDDLNCPLCLKVFKSPRRLPCSHTFCQCCIQSHISDTASVKDTVKEFCCPICGTMVRSEEESSLDRWVYFFPHNTLLLSVLMKSKVKVNILCDMCQCEDVISPAERYCVVCEEAMCGSCLKIHRNQRMLRTHAILNVDDLASKQNIVLQHSAEFLCTEHAHNVELYCKGHKTQLCAKCFLTDHNNCSEVVDLTNETPQLSETLSQIKEQIKKFEDQIKQITDIKVSNLSKLESQVNDLVSEVCNLRETINDVLNDLEKRVRMEGRKIYNDEKKRMEELNQDCRSKITTIKNSNVVMESASKCATQSQMFQLANIIINQISKFREQTENMVSNGDILTLQLDIHPKLMTIAGIPRGEIAKLCMNRNGEIPKITDGFKPLKDCKAEAAHVIEIKGSGDTTPWYSSVKFTFDNQVLMVDYNNKLCYLLDSLFNVITSLALPCKPWDVCMINKNVLAVSLPHAKSVHFLSLKDNSMKPLKQIPTRYKCDGIVAYSAEEMIVSGPCGDGKKYYWSLITLDGKEKSYHEFDGKGHKQSYIALNAFKTRLYISVFCDCSLHCFGLAGKKYFTFKHQDLLGPQAVAMDRDDNLYLAASMSRNIFQVSPDGYLIQIIVNGMTKMPRGICFDQNGEKFVLTTHDTDASLTLYALKDNAG